MRVYISGPYTRGDIGQNVRRAIDAANTLANYGIIVFCPHLTHFWHIVHPHDHDFWMQQDLEWVKACDAVVRLPGESMGADRECEVARENNIPVYTMEEALCIGRREPRSL